MARGACLCNAIRFDVEGPYRWVAHCHCSMCRKHHGSLFSTSLGVHRTRFRWTGGAARVARYRSSAAFERAFCRDCGSKVPALSQSPDVMNVPAGTIEDAVGIRPRTHIFVGSKAACCTIADSLPQFESYPPGMDLPGIVRTKRPVSPGCAAGSCLCGAVAFEVDGDIAGEIDCELDAEVELGPEVACKTIGEVAEDVGGEVAGKRGGVLGLVHCHCANCRRSRGTDHSTDARVRSDRFRWVRGAEVVARYELPSEITFSTAFCRDCGSLMPSVLPAIRCVSIPAGSLDTL